MSPNMGPDKECEDNNNKDTNEKHSDLDMCMRLDAELNSSRRRNNTIVDYNDTAKKCVVDGVSGVRMTVAEALRKMIPLKTPSKSLNTAKPETPAATKAVRSVVRGTISKKKDTRSLSSARRTPRKVGTAQVKDEVKEEAVSADESVTVKSKKRHLPKKCTPKVIQKKKKKTTAPRTSPKSKTPKRSAKRLRTVAVDEADPNLDYNNDLSEEGDDQLMIVVDDHDVDTDRDMNENENEKEFREMELSSSSSEYDSDSDTYEPERRTRKFAKMVKQLNHDEEEKQSNAPMKKAKKERVKKEKEPRVPKVRVQKPKTPRRRSGDDVNEVDVTDEAADVKDDVDVKYDLFSFDFDFEEDRQKERDIRRQKKERRVISFKPLPKGEADLDFSDQRNVTAISKQEPIFTAQAIDNLTDEEQVVDVEAVGPDPSVITEWKRGQTILKKYEVHGTFAYSVKGWKLNEPSDSSRAHHAVSVREGHPFVVRVEMLNLPGGIISEIDLLKKSLAIRKPYLFGGPLYDVGIIDPDSKNAFMYYTQMYWAGPTLESLFRGFYPEGMEPSECKKPSIGTVKFVMEQLMQIASGVVECGLLLRSVSLKDIRMNVVTRRLFLDNKSGVCVPMVPENGAKEWLGELCFAPMNYHLKEHGDEHGMTAIDLIEVFWMMSIRFATGRFQWEKFKKPSMVYYLKEKAFNLKDEDSMINQLHACMRDVYAYIVSLYGDAPVKIGRRVYREQLSFPKLSHLISRMPDGTVDILETKKDKVSIKLAKEAMTADAVLRDRMHAKATKQMRKEFALVNREKQMNEDQAEARRLEAVKKVAKKFPELLEFAAESGRLSTDPLLKRAFPQRNVVNIEEKEEVITDDEGVEEKEDDVIGEKELIENESMMEVDMD